MGFRSDTRYLILFWIIIAFINNSYNLWAIEKVPSNEGSASPLVFSTWEGFEVDKCASIWLIKRFVDSRAQFKFFPKGEIITEGIPFDTPDAKLRRYQNKSTFECIMEKYNITDKTVKRMGDIVHDIEVNVWGKKVYQESRKIKEDIRKIMTSSKSDEGVIKKSDAYFDSLYEVMKSNKRGDNDIR